jgi:agmatinase
MRHRFLQSELEQPEPGHALFHVIPVPYEASVSYGGGTAHGPDAILEASDQLELWDGESVPANLGIYTCAPVDCSGDAVAVLERIRHAVAQSLRHDALPVVLGGEHTVTYGALQALKERYGEFGVVQIDAHADLRDTYEGTPYSHACVMRRAVQDLGLPLVQFGVRAMSLEEAEARQAYNVIAYDAVNLVMEGLPEFPIPKDFPPRLYVTFDVDGLDSSIMPATGTPVPGGLDWYSALALLMRSVRGRQVIGMDVVELAPIAGLHAPTFTAARLVYALMGIVQRYTRR